MSELTSRRSQGDSSQGTSHLPAAPDSSASSVDLIAEASRAEPSSSPAEQSPARHAKANSKPSTSRLSFNVKVTEYYKD